MLTAPAVPGADALEVATANGTGFGLSNTILVPIAPTPTGVDVPPPACPTTETDSTIGVDAPGLLTAGIIEMEAHCEPALPSHDGFVSVQSDVADATLGPTVLPGVLPDLLAINGVHSECRSGRLPDGSIGSTGETTIASLVLGGTPIDVGTLGANTTIGPILGITIVLNEQIPSTTSNFTGMIVNAARITIGSGGGGGGPLGLPLLPAGELIIGHVECSATFQQAVVPTTVAPSTVAPTVAPTTAAPTTAAPTTAAPTTAAPTTAAPTTAAPTTAGPATTTAGATTTIRGSLARTGSESQPMVAVSVFSIVGGVMLLLLGAGRPEAATATTGRSDT